MNVIWVSQPGGIEQLVFRERPTPVPRAREVLVKVAATALNRADLLQREGKYPPPPGESPVLGLEVAGTVVERGAEASRWQEGQAVCGLLAGGGYAEYVTVDEGLLMPVPDGIPLETAAAIPEVFLTAFQALKWLAQLKAGERVLIHAGGSGVGTAAIQLARAWGAEVWITASKGKHDTCRALGAQHTIDYQNENFLEVIQAQTHGTGLDVILDFLAAPYVQPNLKALRTDGRLILLALMGGRKAEAVDLLPVLTKRLRIQGSTLRARPLAYKQRLVAAFQEEVLPGFADGRFQPVVDTVFDWKEVRHAHAYMQANRNTGKILLRIGS